MIDLRLLREDPAWLRDACARKRTPVDLEHGIALEARRRETVQQEESLQAERNRASKEIGARKKAGEDTAAAQEEVRRIGERIKALAEERSGLDATLADLALTIPNRPAGDVPRGDGAEGNVEVARWGEPRQFDFAPKAHWDLAADLGLIDFERAARLSGSGFALYRGLGARLERALFNFMLDLHTARHGYTEWMPPVLINRACMTGTGQLPKFESEMYCTDKGDDLFLAPTAEVPVTNIHRGEILDSAQLPLKYTAYTPCFRREAGAAGKDTRGIIRVHQFDKVELVKFCRPEASGDEHEKLRADAEAVLQALGLPYRVLLLCDGDMSFAAAKCYDLEVWAPGVNRWLEVSSCSNFTDFQARRADIRFRDEDRKVRFVHTLNASGVALPRAFIAILENFQQADGSVLVPEVLRPYLGGVDLLRKG